MRINIKEYTVITMLLAGLAYACEDDRHIYSGPNYVEFPVSRSSTSLPYNFENNQSIPLKTQMIGAHESTEKQVKFSIVAEGTTAVEGLHYRLPSKDRFSFPAQSSFGYIELEAIGTHITPGEGYTIKFQLLDGDLPVSPNYRTHTHTISKAPRPVLNFSKTIHNIKESTSDTVEVQMSFDRALETDVLVEYSIDGTATAGIDYDMIGACAPSLLLKKGETSAKINFRVYDDAELENDSLIFKIISTSPTTEEAKDSVILGENREALFIINDEIKTVHLSNTDTLTLTPEAIGVIPVKVSLSKASDSPLIARYEIQGGVAGRHYHDLNDGGLYFAPGQTEQKIDFQLLNSAFQEEIIYINITLNQLDVSEDQEVKLAEGDNTLTLKIEKKLSEPG